MKRTMRLLAWLTCLVICFSLFTLTGCKDSNDSSDMQSSETSEDNWSDENVDNNGWT